jgi:hypothetical protein
LSATVPWNSASLIVVRAPADIFKRRTTKQVLLSNTGGQWTGILQVIVPAGAWIVHAKATAVNFGAADYVRCRIRIAQRQFDLSANAFGSGQSVYTLVNQVTITTTVTRVFVFECEHDTTLPGISVEPGASLIVARAPGPIG